MADCEEEKKVCRPATLFISGSPSGVRTRVTGVRGRRPRPLDDGTVENFLRLNIKIIRNCQTIIEKWSY